LDCDKGDGFLKQAGVKLPDTTYASVNKSIGLEKCGELCSNNCFCTAYANSDVRGGGSGCILWFRDLIDIREFSDGGQDLYIRVAASELGIHPSLMFFLLSRFDYSIPIDHILYILLR
jgi:hypothetical protein